jgi:hypothetical protein
MATVPVEKTVELSAREALHAAGLTSDQGCLEQKLAIEQAYI